jgi:hypothetical protein
MWSTLNCQILLELELSQQIFENNRNIKFHENPSSVSRVIPCGRTDRHKEANSRFSQFCERALKLRILSTNYVYPFRTVFKIRSDCTIQITVFLMEEHCISCEVRKASIFIM